MSKEELETALQPLVCQIGRLADQATRLNNNIEDLGRELGGKKRVFDDAEYLVNQLRSAGRYIGDAAADVADAIRGKK